MSRVPAAKGLTYLTWAQVEQIDAKLASLAAYAEQSHTGVAMFLQLDDRGLLVSSGQPMGIEKIKPGR